MRIIIAISFFAVTFGCVASTNGIEWSAGFGDFLDGNNWSAGYVPTRPDGCVVTNGGTAQLSVGMVDVSELTLGYANGWGRFEQTGGMFLADTTLIGQQGVGIAQISGGHFAIGTSGINVGLWAGSEGELHVDNPAALATTTGRFYVGNEGVGSLSMRAGQLRSGDVVVGQFGEGYWMHDGGLFDQLFGDFVIGHGGGDVDADVPGPRRGEVHVSSGFLQPARDVILGAGRGSGTLVMRGGSLAATGDSTGSIVIGQGLESGRGSGGPAELRIRGDRAAIFANGDLWMNPNDVASSANLVAEIIGPAHTAIRVGGNAHIFQGVLKIEVDGYVPSPSDSWVLIETGADLENAISTMDAAIDVAGYDPIAHETPQALGTIQGEFLRVDTSHAPLPEGLSWHVDYSDHEVTLSIRAVPEPTFAFWVVPGFAWLFRRFRR